MNLTIDLSGKTQDEIREATDAMVDYCGYSTRCEWLAVAVADAFYAAVTEREKTIATLTFDQEPTIRESDTIPVDGVPEFEWVPLGQHGSRKIDTTILLPTNTSIVAGPAKMPRLSDY